MAPIVRSNAAVKKIKLPALKPRRVWAIRPTERVKPSQKLYSRRKAKGVSVEES